MIQSILLMSFQNVAQVDFIWFIMTFCGLNDVYRSANLKKYDD